jgi:hypothetical protein
VYTVRVVVTDQASTTTSASFQYIVVYNPNGGFVTGAGWINSPAGAYVADPGAFGRAHFGFVSRYQKGATVPTGKTDFEFKTASMNFTSTVYEWLVVAGAKAQYKGVGTINGIGNYGFIVSAIDGQATGGGGSDKVRIKIWDKNNGDALVYDNQPGTTDDASATTAIGGGAVVVHDGKSKARTNNTLQSEPATAATLYPNPVVDKATIDLKGMSAARANTALTDAAGNSVGRPAPKVIGASLLELDMSGLRPGLYILQLRTETAYQVIKVIKVIKQ